MKGSIAITLLGMCISLAGCASQRDSTQVREANTTDHSNTIELLTNSFTSAEVGVSGWQINAKIMWLTSEKKMRHSRPSDIFLPETGLSAFVMPIQNLTIDGPSLEDVAMAVRDELRGFLKKNRIDNVRVLTQEEMRKETGQDN